MELLQAWVRPSLVDALMLLVLLEGLGLWWWHRRTGRGVGIAALVANLLAGLALMAALRAALTEGGAPWVLAWLSVAGLAHLADLRARWRR